MAPVAPLAAGHWPRRLGGLPGPFSAPAGSGESPTRTGVAVELFIQGTWVDITSYVMTRDGSQRINIFRGQADEGSRTDPGRCTFQLNNRDGRFSPRNPVSPYYKLIGRNTPIRVSVPSGNDKSYRFWGEVSAWPPKWDTTGTDVWVEVEAAGILRRLGQGQTPLKSSMFREFTNPARTSIFAYWPCEDGASASQLASGIPGGPAMSFTSGVTAAAFSNWLASDPVPTVDTGYMSGPIGSYPVTAQFATRFFLRLPDAGVPSGTPSLVTFYGTGSAAQWVLYTNSTGALGLRGYDSAGNILSDSGAAVFNANGLRLSVGIELVQNGTSVDWHYFAFRIDDTGFTSLGGLAGSLTSNTFGSMVNVTLGGGGALSNTAFGHVAISNATNAYANTGGAMTAWVGENPFNRVTRLCAEEKIDFLGVFDGQSGNAVTLGAQRTKTFLELVTEATDADGSILIEPTTLLGIGQRTRLALYNQTPQLALNYQSFNLAEVPEPIDDDQHTRNKVTVSRPNGSSATAVDDFSSLSVLPPPAGVGPYDTSVELNVLRDSDLPSHAGWRLHLGTVDEARFPRISINLAHPSFTANGALRQQALAVRPGDRITISNPPAWLPPDAISQLAIGFNETIDNFQHRITFTCVPESPYRVGTIEDATFARLDTAGSVLDQDVSSSATSLVVDTTSGPVWTTTDVPFDINIGGEQITVNGVSGASSPQTFSPVTRSVNGVAKAQAAGTDVRLFQPTILAL